MIERWLKFGAVGMAGVAVQLAALWILVHVLAIPLIVSLVIAVEVALLHNFAWHEAWTWRGQPASARWRRMLRFHFANGLVSLTLNPLFTWALKEQLGMPLLTSNLLAIGGTAVLNFAVADTWVFSQ